MQVKLISVTPDAEKIIAYCARVSSPNQDNPEIEKLLTYCIKNNHWSIYEMADMTVEITTSRGIAAQILRHRSFNFQEFSQRYAKVGADFEYYEARRQDLKNRQNSVDDMCSNDKDWFERAQETINSTAFHLYGEALDKGIAKEQARFLLPLSTKTKLYMKGNIRSWITYLLVRLEKGSQKEHKDIAKEILKIFKDQFPTIYKACKDTYPVFQDEN